MCGRFFTSDHLLQRQTAAVAANQGRSIIRLQRRPEGIRGCVGSIPTGLTIFLRASQLAQYLKPCGARAVAGLILIVTLLSAAYPVSPLNSDRRPKLRSGRGNTS
jgi:hypothetical protein